MSLREWLVHQFWAWIERAIAWRDNREKNSVWFPTCQESNYLYEPLFPSSDGEAYFAKFHQTERGTNPFSPTFLRFKSDILKGRLYRNGTSFKTKLTVPSALPYAVTGENRAYPEGNYAATLKVNNDEIELRGLVADRYYYLPINQPADVELRSNSDLIVSRPIPLVQEKRNKVRFVFALYIDNFSWEIMRRMNLERDMPNIARFFGKGTIFENCHSASNWTLPGAATLVSGRSLSRHLVFHARRRDVLIGKDHPVMAEVFQSAGYLTFQLGCAIRMSPAYGYVKGYDRTVYRWEMPLAETFDLFTDHVSAFPERDHFVWMTVMDAHHVLGHTPDISSQLAMPLFAHDYLKKRVKSPWNLTYDEPNTERYVESIKRIDRHLARIFEFIEDRYEDGEIVACLMSDHGVGFTTTENRPFAQEQTHVPFMLRGPGIPVGVKASEMMQNTDVLPAILKAAGLALPGNAAGEIDGRLPEALGGPAARTYSLSENRYAGQTYLAAIKDPRFQFYLESEGRVDDKGDFQLGDFKVELMQNDDWTTDVSSRFPDIVERYVSEVRKHIGK